MEFEIPKPENAFKKNTQQETNGAGNKEKNLEQFTCAKQFFKNKIDGLRKAGADEEVIGAWEYASDSLKFGQGNSAMNFLEKFAFSSDATRLACREAVREISKKNIKAFSQEEVSENLRDIFYVKLRQFQNYRKELNSDEFRQDSKKVNQWKIASDNVDSGLFLEKDLALIEEQISETSSDIKDTQDIIKIKRKEKVFGEIEAVEKELLGHQKLIGILRRIRETYFLATESK